MTYAFSKLFRCMMEAHGIHAPSLPPSSFISMVLGRDPEGFAPSPSLAADSGRDVWADLHRLSAAAELDRSPDDAKRLGAVYTPRAITERVTANALELWREQTGSARIPIIEDPGCGAGAFVVSAIRALSLSDGISVEDIVRTQVRAGDVSGRAVEDTRAIIEFLLRVHGFEDIAIERAAGAVRVHDFLNPSPEMAWPTATDIFVGNPPYIKIQNIEPTDRLAYERSFGNLIRGSYSTTILFIAQMLAQVSEDGVIGLITQNNFFTSIAAEPMRRRIEELGALRRVIDFGHHRVFESASAYTCLLFLSRTPSDRFEYAHETDLSGTEPTRMESVPARHLSAKKWRLAYPTDLMNLERIEAAAIPLGSACAIRVGFATLKDKAFFVEENEHGDVMGTWNDGTRHAVEPAITQAAIRIADFDSVEALQGNTRRIIFPYRRTSRRFEALDWNDIEQKFPRAARHLASHREALLGRSKGAVEPSAWYHWGRTQAMAAPGPKLLTKTFNTKPTFIWDDSDSLFCNGYSVSMKAALDTQGWTLSAVQRILNSRVMKYYAALTAFSIAGGYQCYQKNFIERFGLPDLEPGEAVWIEQALTSEVEAFYAERVGLNWDAVETSLERSGERTQTQQIR